MDKQQLIDRLKERLEAFLKGKTEFCCLDKREALKVSRLLEQEQGGHLNYCKSCNKPMCQDCPNCERLWST